MSQMTFQTVVVSVIWKILDSFLNFLSVALCYRLRHFYGLYCQQPQLLTNEHESLFSQCKN